MAVIKWVLIILFVSILHVLVRKGLYAYLEDFKKIKEEDHE